MITAMKLEDLVHFSLGQTEGVMVILVLVVLQGYCVLFMGIIIVINQNHWNTSHNSHEKLTLNGSPLKDWRSHSLEATKKHLLSIILVV